MPEPLLRFDVAPYRLSGVVIGAVLNHAPQLAALGDAVNQPPYKAPPRAPVLAVRPRNTLAGTGEATEVPPGEEGVEVGATLGIVIGRVACRVPPAQALAHVAGYLVAADLSLPLASHYRPAARFKARDGFCRIGPRVVAAAEVPCPDALAVRVSIDGVALHASSTGGRIRGVAQLIADVSAFMTLREGDLLLLGAAHGAPRARSGQCIEVSIEGLGTLAVGLVAEGVAA
jgi:5-oxopent-3-ene-1,2,5-tricarboxylate decarboxylase / 2-hydroxyhepta-2,4-diene-1,7-dioate isomerase